MPTAKTKTKPKAKAKKQPAAKKKAPAKAKRKAPKKANRLRVNADFRVKRGKRAPEAGSVFAKLVQCVHASGSTALEKIVDPFLKKKGVSISKGFKEKNGKLAKLAFTRSYVLRSLKHGYLVAA